MSKRKFDLGWLASLLALFALSFSVAPWFAMAAAMSPAVQADAAYPFDDPAPNVTPEPTASQPKLIALTFDDGPRRSTTTALLDGLAERGVKVTFFLIGAQIANNEDVILRMDQEGHQVGIHTYDHVKLTGLNKADFAAQVDRTRTILKNLLGHNDFLLRPPYGLMDDGIRAHAGCPIILWSIDPEDWGDRNVQREVEHVVSNARDGSIILMHDIFSESVDAALQIVDRLHQEGYLFVTVDQLFAARHLPLEAGKNYSDAYPYRRKTGWQFVSLSIKGCLPDRRQPF